MKSALATISLAAGCNAVAMGPYPGYEGPLKIGGDVDGYLTKSGNAYIRYTLKGLEGACRTTPEGVDNACGIHIHEGKTCDDADSVGGHYFDDDQTTDPWSSVGYVTKHGFTQGRAKAAIGKGLDVAGRAVVVHDSTGVRVGCALIPSELPIRDTNLVPFPGWTSQTPFVITGTVGAYLYNGDAYVWYNLAGDVDADCASGEVPDGIANACGIHIHEGTTCDDERSVGDHYFDKDSISNDPWASVRYRASPDGTFKGKIFASIGAGRDISGRVIVVHDKWGQRRSCALIEGELPELSSDSFLV